MCLERSDKSDSPRRRAARCHGFLKLLPSYITFVRHKTLAVRRALPVNNSGAFRLVSPGLPVSVCTI